MHQITEIDLALGTVERHHEEPESWHGLESVTENLSTENCKLKDLNVKIGDMNVSIDGENLSSQYQIPCIQHPTQEGKLHFLGLPFSDSYKLFTPKEFVEFIGECFKEAGMDNKISFVTTLAEGRKMTVSRALPEADFKDARGYEIKSYINFLNSHDKTWPLFVNISEIRTVCANSASQNLDCGGASCKHTPDALELFIQKFPSTLKAALDGHKNSANDYLLMSEIPFTQNEATYFYSYLLSSGVDSEKKLATRGRNVIEEGLIPLFKNGRGIFGENAADVYCAVTEYYTHKGSIESNSSGGSADMKKRTCKSLLLSNKLQEYIEIGRKAYMDSAI